MKKIVMLFGCLLVAASVCAQTQSGTWELSLSGSLGSLSSESEASGYVHSSSSTSETFVSRALRPGFYVVNGLALEPEMYWTAIEKSEPAFSLTANLAYNFLIPESRFLPFLLAGYGLGNAIPVFQRVLGRSSDGFDITVLNAGTGVKIFATNQIALRVEYRYQHFSYERNLSSGRYATTYSETHRFHNVLIGFSFFLL